MPHRIARRCRTRSASTAPGSSSTAPSWCLLGLFAIAAPGVATLAVEPDGRLAAAARRRLRPDRGDLSRPHQRPASGGTCSPRSVCVLAGLSLLTRPVAGVITLTIILAAYLLAGGIVRIMLAIGYRTRHSQRLGLDADQRPDRHRAGAHHHVGHAGHRHLGARPAGRHQPADDAASRSDHGGARGPQGDRGLT